MIHNEGQPQKTVDLSPAGSSPETSIVHQLLQTADKVRFEAAIANALANFSGSLPSAPQFSDMPEMARRAFDAAVATTVVDQQTVPPVVEQEPVVLPEGYEYAETYTTLEILSGTVNIRNIPSRLNSSIVGSASEKSVHQGILVTSGTSGAFDWYYIPGKGFIAAVTAIETTPTETPSPAAPTPEPAPSAPAEVVTEETAVPEIADGTAIPVPTEPPRFEGPAIAPTPPPETQEAITVLDPTQFEIPHTREDLRYTSSFEVEGLAQPVEIRVWFDQEAARENNFRVSIPTSGSQVILNQISSEYLSGTTPFPQDVLDDYPEVDFTGVNSTISVLSVDSYEVINKNPERNTNLVDLDLTKPVHVLIMSEPLNSVVSPVSGEPLTGTWFMADSFQYHVSEGNQIYIYPGSYPFVPDPAAPISMDPTSESFKAFSLTRSYTPVLGLIKLFSDLNRMGFVSTDTLQMELTSVINKPSNLPVQFSTTDVIQDFRSRATDVLPTLVAP